MKRIHFILIALLLFVPIRSNGNSPRTFEGIGIGPRALGMGGAFVALADDASSVYWNPAGLAFVENPTFYGEISARKRVLYLPYYNGVEPDFSEITDPIRDLWDSSGRVSVDQLSVVYPFHDAVVAVSHLRPFENYSERSNGVHSDLVIRQTSLTFAAKSGESFAIGFHVDYNRMKIDYKSSTFLERFSGNTYSIGIGGLVKPDTIVSLGFVFNPGSKYSGWEYLEWNVNRERVKRKIIHEIPLHVRFGLGMKPHKRVNLALGFNIVDNIDQPVTPDYYSYSPEIEFPTIQAGFEYWISESLPMRLGAFRIREETALTFGSGYRTGPILTDIAFIRFPSEERQETRGILSLAYEFQN
jgi:hypothetical protein